MTVASYFARSDETPSQLFTSFRATYCSFSNEIANVIFLWVTSCQLEMSYVETVSALLSTIDPTIANYRTRMADTNGDEVKKAAGHLVAQIKGEAIRDSDDAAVVLDEDATVLLRGEVDPVYEAKAKVLNRAVSIRYYQWHL